ncbi:MAG TPA: hypothetical protein VKA48_03795 [Gammaproteobacteria bacterium]|nr:hypothetical protein [Gammaproteobacteria bacterium]
MSVRREIHCDVCGESYLEEAPNAGWPGWGQLQGISLDGADNPHLCPSCLTHAANFVDWLRQTGGDGSLKKEG